MSLAGKVVGDLRVNDVTWTTITFDQEDQDELNGFTATDSKIYAPYAGLYFVEACLSHNHSTGDNAKARGCRLLVNGSSTYTDGSSLQYAGIITSASGSSLDTRQGVSSFLFLNAGDYVEVQGYQNTGGANNIDSSGGQFAWSNLAMTLFGSTAAEAAIR
jgi:hypothetical protein